MHPRVRVQVPRYNTQGAGVVGLSQGYTQGSSLVLTHLRDFSLVQFVYLISYYKTLESILLKYEISLQNVKLYKG